MISYKTMTVPLNTNDDSFTYLKECNRMSAQVWNICIDIAEKYLSETGIWIQRNELQKRTKKCVPLHAKGIHLVVHKYLYARDASLKAKKAGRRDVLYPYKKKQYFVTGWDSQSIRADYANNRIYLSKPEIVVENKKRRQNPIVCRARNMPKNIVEVELIYKDKYYLTIKYKDDSTATTVTKSNNVASIDLGEIHAITSIDSRGNAIIITGRKMREIKQLRNIHYSELHRRMSGCNRNSVQYLKYLKALHHLKHSTDRKLKDCIHKIAHYFINYCLDNEVSVVYYGDLDSATRDTKIDKFGNRNLRQKLSQWCYGQLIKSIKNKLSRHEIKMEKVDEYYTSKKCPNCSTMNKPKGRNYNCCQCKYNLHRDIVGAINILNDNSTFKIKKYKTIKYLQIV